MFNLKIILMFMLMLSMLLILINLSISKKKYIDREKASPFECGFDPMSSPRLPFSMQFYMISIIFLIFDVEIMIFLPMIPSFNINKFSTWSETVLIFVTILLLGIYIEWNDGALKWLK